MNFQDLTNDCRRILTALSQTPSANRQRIADLCQLPATKVSRDLNRLEGFGFVDKPEEHGGDWRISEAGRRLFGETVPMIVATGRAEPVPQPEPPGPQSDPVADTPPPDTVPEPFVETKTITYEFSPLHTQTITDSQSESPQPFSPESMPVVSQVLLENQELNAAMDEVVARLGQGRISATALRTYRRLIDALPPPVQKALSPITQLVEAQP